MAFNGGANCFVSNQDTNVVALVSVNDQQTGSLGQGCQSPFLNAKFPGKNFLDGTWIASQNGALPGVKVTAENVPAEDGGLAVSIQQGKVQNSVRDLLLSNDVLYVCNEVGMTIGMYSAADGTFVGSEVRLRKTSRHIWPKTMVVFT